MPDRFGRFRGISVPELPWLREKPAEKPWDFNEHWEFNRRLTERMADLLDDEPA